LLVADPFHLAQLANKAVGDMAMRHRTLPMEGVQFHPESVLAQGGHLMLARWLEACGDGGAARRLAPALSAEVETLREAAFA
jgi:para-aminobenzoate synthetase component 2